MPYERTTRRNPQQLAIEQHFHTAHAISKFYNSENKVQVMELETGDIVERHKRAKVFCSKRTWDQRAETGYMVPIEDAFHEEIDNIKGYGERSHEAISRYCLLWRLRHEYHLEDTQDGTVIGVSGSGLTKEQEEVIERKRGMFIRDGGNVPSRFDIGVQIQMKLDYFWPACKNFKWGLLSSNDGEFLVSDGYGDFPFMPITPTQAFYANVDDQSITKSQLVEFNKESVSKASEYYFARDLDASPIA